MIDDVKKTQKSTKPEGVHAIYVTADFHVSGTFFLTSCFLINHWFLNILGISGANWFFKLMATLNNNTTNFLNYMLLSVYIWWKCPAREPPDKQARSFRRAFENYTSEAIYIFEDIIRLVFKKEVNVAFWVSLIMYHVKKMWTTKKESNDDTYWYENRAKHIYVSSMRNVVSRYHGKILYSNVVLSYTAKMSKEVIVTDPFGIDEDSYQFVIDTGTTFHICKSKELFLGGIKKAKDIWIKGVGGKVKVRGYGSIKVTVTDDNSNECDLVISNVLYVPESPTNLLSPQLWSETSSKPTGTGEMTIGGLTMLFWNNHEHTKMVPHHPELKLPILTVNNGLALREVLLRSNFTQPSIPTALNTSTPVLCRDPDGAQRVHVIPLDDDDCLYHEIKRTKQKAIIVDEFDILDKDRETDTAPRHPLHIVQDAQDSTMSETNTQATDDDTDHTTIVTEESLHDDASICTEIEDEVGSTTIDEAAHSLVYGMTPDQEEWLRNHYNLKHLPISYMRKLAENNVIPKKLAKVKPPICVACLNGKQHRRPWKGRGKNDKSLRRAHHNFPGAQTSTDQMVSPYGGLIPQMRGRLMKAKYFAATVFVDHYSDYTYVHLSRDTKTDSTMEAKFAYESLLHQYGHDVRAYHADNGRYAEPAFHADAKKKMQGMSYCGSGHHSQNGIAERRIQSLSQDARSMLAHGRHIWPEVINKSLWPFAIKAACRARNKFNLDSHGLSPEMKLSGTQVDTDIRNEHPLFCPVFTLDRRLQSGNGMIPKWNPRSNAGVYLGHSPEHASNVALVLNLSTGLVSPQYLLVFDDTFC